VSESEAAAIESLVQERSELRRAKKFAEADRIREELAATGVMLEDTTERTIWKKVK
jgi:cysteinyl-tRNA synthetase